MRLFDLDGPLFTAMSKLSKIVAVNIVFCICCIPIVTVGAATTALHDCMRALLEEVDDDKLVRRFFKTFKQKFVPSTILWILCLFVFAFLFVYQNVIKDIRGTFGRSYQIMLYFLSIIFLFGFQYIFPMQARYEVNIRYILKNAWIVSILALPWSLASIAATGIMIYVSFFMNTDMIGTAAYLWLVAGFGVLSYINNIFFQKAFEKVMPEEG